MKKLILILCFALATSVYAGEVYEMYHAASTNPDIAVTQIELTEDSTIIQLSYTVPADATSNKNLWLAQPSSVEAFVILDPASKQVYSMKYSEGVAIAPHKDVLQPGEQKSFTIVFDRFPMKRFHLIEGQPSHRSPDNTYWDFMNIRLPRK